MVGLLVAISILTADSLTPSKLVWTLMVTASAKKYDGTSCVLL